MANEVLTTAEVNVIKAADLAKAREVEFVYRFKENIKALQRALGVTRPIAKQAGTVLKAYKAVGTLESDPVAEGDVIPLSKYQVQPVTFGEITLDKFRKASTAEAIIKGAYSQAVTMTDERALRDLQARIKSRFYTFLASGTGTATGANLQKTVAQVRAQLAIKFEDQDVRPVYFINPVDMADYMGSAQIITQTAFGMTYFEDFLGLGTVIEAPAVPAGTVYGTVKDNIVLYYVPVNGADGLGTAFDFTTDETGLVGIHHSPTYDRMQFETVLVSGLTLFAERIDGIVKGTISGT